MSIVPIRPGLQPEPEAGEVNTYVIAALEELLDKARTGEVIGIAYAVQHPKQLTSYWRAGFCSRATLGALALLQHWLCAEEMEAE